MERLELVQGANVTLGRIRVGLQFPRNESQRRYGVESAMLH